MSDADRIRLPPGSSWWWEVALGVATFVTGVVGSMGLSGNADTSFYYTVFTLLMVAAVVVARRSPASALALAWVAGAFQVGTWLTLTPVHAVLGYVAWASGRYGPRLVLWASGLSIPAGMALAVWYLTRAPRELLGPLQDVLRSMRESRGDVGIVFLGLVVLAVPWLVGIAQRYAVIAAAAGDAERDAQQKRRLAEDENERSAELARLEAARARLAHDVHDVVGHSLAVILAQAQAAEFIDDVDGLRRSLENISGVARRSLTDVRAVLGRPGAEPNPTADLDLLVESVRQAGVDVRVQATGEPRPLAPDVETTVFRVLQEMLTNALKHGDSRHGFDVALDWTDGLTLTVTNVSLRGGVAQRGLGIPGMRERLEAVGGDLVTSRRGDGGHDVFEARMRIPRRTPRPARMEG